MATRTAGIGVVIGAVALLVVAARPLASEMNDRPPQVKRQSAFGASEVVRPDAHLQRTRNRAGQTNPLSLNLKTTRPPEVPNDPPASPEVLRRRAAQPAKLWTRGSFTSVQVNVDASGNNIVGDAANEPSIAIDPTNPDRIVIAWRQFDSISSDFRQAGIAYSHDGGQTWTFPGVLGPGEFRSDPVLGADADGNFYFSSLYVPDPETMVVDVFKSTDGGVLWSAPVYAFGGDKQWFVVDQTSGIGQNHLYQIWNIQFTCCYPYDFTRSINQGASFQSPVETPWPKMKWGTMSVDPDGVLYMAGATLNQETHIIARSSDARNPGVTPTFDLAKGVDLGGQTVSGGINPWGILSQVWVDTDHSTGPTRGYVYILGAVYNPMDTNILNVKLIRSVDGGETWSSPVVINDDPSAWAWHWFAAMSVAPNGRIDVTWNDTRNDPVNPSSEFALSEVFYAYSLDAGRTWSPNVPVTPAFDSSLGYPQQLKMGDYTHMLSDNGGASLAFAATFNGEEDVYFLRIPFDCNNNGVEDPDDIAGGTSNDCNHNDIPDECEPDEDCNDSLAADICDIGAGTSSDCDANLVPDECDPQDNCNTNENLDICDLTDGTSRDCNENGIPDECDIQSGSSNDRNDDGIPDECEGACCFCGGGCLDMTWAACAANYGTFNGWGVLCTDTTCPLPPENDDCMAAEILPSIGHQIIPIDNRCTTLDGPLWVGCETGEQPFGTDIWYHYVAPADGMLTVSLCENTFFDAIMGIYSTGEVCECPMDNTSLIECGDDSCGIGGGPPVIMIPATADTCYTIRVGGWDFETGTGEMEVFFEPDSLTTSLDIKPGSCPNPVNPRSHGVVPMSVVGSEFFDVTAIDTESLVLRRTDGIGGAIAPIARRSGRIGAVEDVATPFNGDKCDCHDLGGDGVDDLVLHFSTEEMVEELELYSARHDDEIELTIMGHFLDGGAFEGSDCVRIVGREPHGAHLRNRRGPK